MLDITNDNLLLAGADWYEWQYLQYIWKSLGRYVLLTTNIKEMC